MMALVDGSAPAIDGNKIPTLDGLAVHCAVSSGFINTQFGKPHYADLVELGDGDRGMGSTSPLGRQ